MSRRTCWIGLLLTATLAFTAGLAWQRTAGRRFSPEVLFQLRRGMTRDQVAELLGQPLDKDLYAVEFHFHDNPVFAFHVETRHRLVAPSRPDLPVYWILQPGIRPGGLLASPEQSPTFYVGKELCVCAHFDDQDKLWQAAALPLVAESASLSDWLELQYDRLTGAPPPPKNAPLPSVPIPPPPGPDGTWGTPIPAAPTRPEPR